MDKLTLKKLAEELNLSISTVSKALNDSFEISDDTKLRVQKYAEFRNYKPNIIASSLKSGKSYTIAVIIPYLSNPFLSQLLEGAQMAAHENNYKLIFMQTSENAEIEKDCLEYLKSQNIDGVLITPSANSDINFLKKFNTKKPLVLVDRIDFDIDTFKIGIDSEKSTFLATEYFIKKGIKKIFLIIGENIGISNNRHLGYTKALQANGIHDHNVILVDYGQSRSDLITNLTHQLKVNVLTEQTQIGILATTDTLTVLTLTILSNMGISVPDKVNLLGFSNTIDADAMNPALSTIVQPAQEIGYLGIEKLLLLIKSKNRFQENVQTILLDSEVVLRKSC